MNDLEIIKEIEKALWLPLQRVDKVDFEDWIKKSDPDARCYVVNEQNQITTLRLSYTKPTNTFFSLVEELRKLHTLDLSYNHLTNIDGLKELKQLNTLDLSRNKLTNIDGLEELKQLTTLDLSYNHLTNIDGLKELKQLNTLELSGNKLTNIDVLKELKQLNTLGLNGNKLTNIDVLKELKQLNTLGLSGNKLTNIDVLKELKLLNTLNLSYNDRTNIDVLKELKQLNTLDLSHNKLTNIDGLEELKQLTTLDLRLNQLTNIDVLKELKQLNTLDLSYNKLTNIDGLKELKQLNTLTLNSNKLTNIDGLKELKQLNTLDLSLNQLTNIDVLKELKKLNTLDLTWNKLTNIDVLKELKLLNTLDLTWNKLTNIDVLKELKLLNTLNLSYNDRTNIDILKELKQLNTLDLGSNKLTNIDILKELKQLKKLNLTSNKLRNIEVLKELKQLNTLNLNANKLRNIDVLKKLKQLNVLSLNTNKLRNIDGLKELKQLNELSLVSNKLRNIDVLNELKQLNKLYLSLNKLTNIDGLKELKQLNTLELDQNELTNIDGLKELKQLDTLLLKSNKLKSIDGLKELKQLNVLSLSRNKLTSLPKWITEPPLEILYSDNSKWGRINVGENPLTSPPPEIIKQGKEAMRAYFQSLEKEETVRLHEAKILLVGDGKAGKTSLLKQFQGLPFDEHECQTHGINVQSLSGNQIIYFDDSPEFNQTALSFFKRVWQTITPKNISSCQENDFKTCRLHFWDFGGQEIMHASHRFFMSNRSLYILVLDSRNDTVRCHWRWLRHIEKYGGKSPLIVVMNQIDANPSYNIEQKSINARFQRIENRFFQISCKTGKNLPALIRNIAASVPAMELYGFEISKSWLAIRKDLEQATEAQNYINQKQFIAICEQHKVDDEISRMTLLKLLNDLGTVLYFENIRLTDIYVLDPHWVTVGVYKIINSEKTKDGILHEDDLHFILNKEHIRCAEEYDPANDKNFAYIVQEQEYLVRIMEEFELCYCYDRHQYLLPNQLPKEPAQEPRLKGDYLLVFIMEYDYLPSSLFSRLMVRLKEDIPKEQKPWRYGMLLEHKQLGVQALIKMEEQHNKITIKIQGGLHDKRQYLSIIRHQIAGLGFNELEPKELIPLPGHDNAFADYKALLGYERAGRDEYFDGILGETFSVSELLDSVVSKEERNKEERIMVETKIDIHDIGNPQVNQNVTQNNTQTATQNQSVDLLNQLREAQGLFHNLKDDILDEAEIEIEDEKEKKRVANELSKAEKALTEAEAAAEQGKEPDAATKSRLEEFFNSLADKSSRLGKALEFVDQGTQKVQKLARTYNSIAGNVGLPTVPPLLLGKEKE